ncbi:MAG: hypothetical protein MUC44_02595, partial [Beijerinckiaceae bacterium]|nr:hypothetical protein [Beijerinckiaceae bacterium]
MSKGKSGTGNLPAGADPKAFTDLLFGRVAAEDIAIYDSTDLNRFAKGALEQLARARKPRITHVSLRDEAVDHAGVRRQITIVEVINDNMPFLLDS